MIKNLGIWESFDVDYRLPKFQVKDDINHGNQFMSGPDVFDSMNSSEPKSRGMMVLSGVWAKIRTWWVNRREAAEEAGKKLPEGIFDDAHEFLRVLEVSMVPDMKERLAAFDLQIANAKKMGQRGLVARLTEIRQRVVYELALAGGDFPKYLTEEQVVRLINECRKGLTVTYIKDFGRVIPQNILDIKMKADALKVFDNYVVLHFDPDKKDITPPPRDPILFGVIRDARKLYFIADWIDDVCDFTLDKAEKFLTSVGETNPVKNILDDKDLK